MNPIKKFVYYSLQIIMGISVFIYAGIRYRDVHDFDNCYFKLSDWFTLHFLENER